MSLPRLLDEIRRCDLCQAHLPLGAKPLLQGSQQSRILIIGQAPGAAAHTSGVPWDDRSGKRLRDWLGMDHATFYDAQLVALIPMGFCYPGKSKSGDMPPRPECAPLWHEALLAQLPKISMTIYLGRYAFDAYLSTRFATLTDAVAAHHQLLPEMAALPHPSPRNNRWLSRHPWFSSQVLPRLREAITTALK